jgi:hypothetical protein
VSVEIRYVELVQSVLVVRRGERLRFRVLTDADRFSWTLRRAGGRVVRADASAAPGVVVVHLPARTRPGRYVLEVEANDHRDRAVVHVLRGRA